MAKKPNKFIQMIAGDGVEDDVREFAKGRNIDLDKLEKFHEKHFSTQRKRDEAAKMVNEQAESGNLGPAMIMAMNQQKITVIEEHGKSVQARRNFLARGEK
jgi:hypothetical protein